MYLITGASDNHYLSLLNMINSFIKYNDKHKLIIYNLGLEDSKWKNIKEKYKEYQFLYKVFNYSIYPEWFNINIEAGSYAWKPIIIYDTYIEYKDEIIVWMDAGNLITENLQKLEDYIIHYHIYSGISAGTIEDWTYYSTIKIMECKNINELNRNNACLGFNTKIDIVKEFISDFYECAQNKNYIAPEGSSRKNHRQDQSVFTILFYKYVYDKNMKFYNHSQLCHSLHNDVD
jgi:hypothetical protein